MVIGHQRKIFTSQKYLFYFRDVQLHSQVSHKDGGKNVNLEMTMVLASWRQFYFGETALLKWYTQKKDPEERFTKKFQL